MERDLHSFSRPDSVRVTHCALDLEISFDKRVISGTARLHLERLDPGAPLSLDTRDLLIHRIHWCKSNGSGDASYMAASYRLGERDAILGSPLIIDLPAAADTVLIEYSSQPGATGLQWLLPEQTDGKNLPFLFSQNQSIHARSWLPIQDTPGVRITYEARIKAPADFKVLMSAEQKGFVNGAHEFSMSLPVPAYLMAIAVGDLEFASTGNRTGVYAEPSLLPAAAQEFSDMEQIVCTVEKLYGPYRWGRYDLLVLPPSFPFGGMENPCLTFASPTIIAGDKSLVSVVSHELAHSWSGNLVTNATWRDFWLNEGFTTYIENRIQEEVYGQRQAVMEQVLDRRELQRELARFAERDQILHIDLEGRDPDEGTTRVPYVKGALFLRQMEQAFGRSVFDQFLRSYFDRFAFQSVATETALEFIRTQLLDQHPDQARQIPVMEWVYMPGLPHCASQAISEPLEMVSQAARDWSSGKFSLAAIDTASWNAQQWLEFLQTLARPLPVSKVEELDAAYKLNATGNCEILEEWLLIAIESHYEAAYQRLESFLIQIGRLKYLKRLYGELMKTPEGNKLAQAIYRKARPGYHPIAQIAIDKLTQKA